MAKDNRPTGPVVDDKESTHGGFSDIARVLNELFPNRRRPISRQLVHKWYMYREDNKFPEAASTTGSTNGGKGHPEFNYTVVVGWYERERLHRDERRYIRSRTAMAAVALPTQRATTGEEPMVA